MHLIWVPSEFNPADWASRVGWKQAIPRFSPLGLGWGPGVLTAIRGLAVAPGCLWEICAGSARVTMSAWGIGRAVAGSVDNRYASVLDLRRWDFLEAILFAIREAPPGIVILDPPTDSFRAGDGTTRT